MKKFLHIALTMVALMVGLCANAESLELKDGKNAIPSYKSISGYYVATEDAKVQITCHEVFNVRYKGVEAGYQYVSGQFIYEVDNVAKGDTVYVGKDFTMSSLITIATLAAGKPTPVELTTTIPQTGKTFPWTATGLVSLTFNRAVTFSSIKVQAGSKEYDVEDIQAGANVGFNLTSALKQVAEDGELKPGEKFTVVLKGLCDAADRENVYNENGELKLEYLMPHPQHNIVSATVNGENLNYAALNTYTFLSYYPVDGEDGVFVFEFDDDVKSLSSISFISGNVDLSADGKYHNSKMEYKIDGKKVIVDARGVLRTVAALFPAMINDEESEEGGMLGTFSPSPVTITLSNVLDSNGNPFYSAAIGSVGSFSYSMPYKELEDNVSIDGDNLAAGSEVKTGTEVSIWINDATLKFEGLEVTYFVKDPDEAVEDTLLMPMTAMVTEFKSEPDAVEGIIVRFKMPDIDEAFPGSTVRVALKNAATSDGMPHSLYIEYVAGAKGEDDPQGIVGTGAAKSNGDIYSINGAKISRPVSRGIYVVGDRKVLLP